MDMRYFKIPVTQSEAILADVNAVGAANFALFTELAQVPIDQIVRSVSYPMMQARFDGIVTPTPPLAPGWRLVNGCTDRYVPARQTKEGKAIAKQLRGLDLLDIYSALQRSGIDPTYQFRGSAGVNTATPEILLTWRTEWELPSWPEWVQEIKGSEYHAILEATPAAQEAGA